MRNAAILRGLVLLSLFAAGCQSQPRPPLPNATTGFFNVLVYGAKGSGRALDTPAINRAIEHAASSGGGTVYFPAGEYLSTSIRLKSNVSLYLDQGATIVAADPKE